MVQDGLELSVKRLIKFDKEGSVRAYCDLLVNNAFLIKGLRVVEGKNGVFVSMPRQQGKGDRWFDSVETLTKEVRAEVGRVVLKAYEQSHQPEDVPAAT